MVFSTNQFRHLYVATAFKEAANATAQVVTDKGDITLKTTKNGDLYFQYKGPGGILRSDLIDPKTIMYAKATNADDMARKVKAVIVTLNSDVNGGQPVVGQDYILKIAFRQFVGMSDEDVYLKYGMVHAYKDMTAEKFYATLAVSLAKNFSRELTKLVKISLITGADADPIEVLPTMKVDSLNDAYTGIVIEEYPQYDEWVRGTRALTPVYFEVTGDNIILDGDEVAWATVEDDVDEGRETIPNGYVIADMEYFYHGERGDIYRGISWPNVIPTKYMIEDPSKGYHTLDIHYAYIGSNEAVQKSEKDITIVCEDKTVLNAIIGAVNTATGLEIETV